MDAKLFFSDPDPTEEISDPIPDPTFFLNQEETIKKFSKTAAQILILKKKFLKPTVPVYYFVLIVKLTVGT